MNILGNVDILRDVISIAATRLVPELDQAGSERKGGRSEKERKRTFIGWGGEALLELDDDECVDPRSGVVSTASCPGERILSGALRLGDEVDLAKR